MSTIHIDADAEVSTGTTLAGHTLTIGDTTLVMDASVLYDLIQHIIKTYGPKS